MIQTSYKTIVFLAALVFAVCYGSMAHADVAVLIQISGDTVELKRVERFEAPNSVESIEIEASTDLLKYRASQTAKPELDAHLSDDRLFVQWFDESGEMIHHETLQDPRFIHAPGSEEVVLPGATLLLRAPSNAVLLRVKPRNFRIFIDLKV